MCATADVDDIGWGLRFRRGTWTDAYLWRSGQVRGYCVVRWKGSGRHVVDPTDLEPQEATGFWEELLDAARALQQHFAPMKLNYELLGNALPHLHSHVIPRYVSGDPAPGGPLPFEYLDEGRQPEQQLLADVQALRQITGHRLRGCP
jgi:diadenosine tetraphosphate (Ap4A) HIT family hydrolase